MLKEPFDALGRELLERMEARYPGRPWQLHISRIYRDARRLFGRGPYKDHLWLTVWESADKRDNPAFWFEISASSWQYGVGFFEARPSEMEAYRRFIRENPAAVERLDDLLRAHAGWDLIGPEYKRPKGDVGERLNRWYNKKWMGISAEYDFAGEILSPDLPAFLAGEFFAMEPFYEFFCQFRQDETENYSDL